MDYRYLPSKETWYIFDNEEIMKRFIPVNEPLLVKEKELVMQCLDTGWISSEGPFVNQFEEKLSKRLIENME